VTVHSPSVHDPATDRRWFLLAILTLVISPAIERERP
jgi:hypothetical protein